MKIDKRIIHNDFPPYIIGEISANHNGSIDNAKKIIMLAKKGGFDAVKLQTYTAETLTIASDKEDFFIKSGLWAGKSLFSLYEEAHMPWEWQPELFKYARRIGITIFSSVFDKSSIEFLESLNCPAYKIASFECIDIELIEFAAKTGKPIIISTGLASFEEIETAYKTAIAAGAREVALLHCISSYPAKCEKYKLSIISDLKKKFNVVVGLSDHSIGNLAAACSIPLGGRIVEKHITLDNNGGGPDDPFSLSAEQYSEFCNTIQSSWESLGVPDYVRDEAELENICFRRSLYFVSNLKAGEKIKRADIRSIRPGYGLPPKFLENFIGKKILKECRVGDRVDWSVIEHN